MTSMWAAGALNPPAPNATFDVFCNRKIPGNVPIFERSGAEDAAQEPDEAAGLKQHAAECEAALANRTCVYCK